MADVLTPVSPREAGPGWRCVDALMHEGLDAVYPAAALLVAREGDVVLYRAYGWIDPETRQRPARMDSLFDLASLTKLFTALAFMTLVERGYVELDTPVSAVLPEFGGVRSVGPAQDPATGRMVPPDPAFAGMRVETCRVTFYHLLTHTSGLAASYSLHLDGGNDLESAWREGPVPLPHEVPAGVRSRRMAALYACDFAYPPGKRMVYSDLGLILLGEAISRLAGVSLETYVRRAVLAPLGLTEAQYNPLLHGVSPERLVPSAWCAWRQRRCAGEVHDEKAAALGGVAGHAGLFATAGEVAALGQMALNGGRYNGARFLRPETVAEMTRVHVDEGDRPRGLGWMLRSQQGSSSGWRFGPRSYGHTGFTGTSLWVDPGRALVVALLTNRVYRGRDPAAIAAFRPRLHDAVIEALEG
jgi:CubicO group peptidase (beta-lactamase class C family)